MGIKTLFISDVGGPKRLEVMNGREINVDQIIIVGDLLGYSWAQEADPLKEGRETLKSMLKRLKECANDIFFLPGNADLRPDLCEDICHSLDVILLTDRVEGIIYGSGLFEGRGYSLVSWGPGAGIGGIRGYLQELELLKEGMFPHSTIFLNSQSSELLNPIYSGRLFYETFKEKLRESRSKKRIVISHMPPYMGNDILQLSNPATTNEWLDVVTFSRVEGVNYSFTHVGDIFFRKALNENHNSIDSAYFGHVEEGEGEAYLGNINMRNLGSFSESLYIIEL